MFTSLELSVGEFYPPGQAQLGYQEATEALKQALLTTTRSGRNYGQSPRARAGPVPG